MTFGTTSTTYLCTCCQSIFILTSMHMPSNHMHVHVHPLTCMCIHSHACASTHVHVHSLTCMCIHSRACASTHVHVHPLTCMYIPPLTCMQVIGPFCLLVTTRSNFVLMALDGCSCKPAAALTTEWYKVSG